MGDTRRVTTHAEKVCAEAEFSAKLSSRVLRPPRLLVTAGDLSIKQIAGEVGLIFHDGRVGTQADFKRMAET